MNFKHQILLHLPWSSLSLLLSSDDLEIQTQAFAILRNLTCQDGLSPSASVASVSSDAFATLNSTSPTRSGATTGAGMDSGSEGGGIELFDLNEVLGIIQETLFRLKPYSLLRSERPDLSPSPYLNLPRRASSPPSSSSSQKNLADDPIASFQRRTEDLALLREREAKDLQGKEELILQVLYTLVNLATGDGYVRAAILSRVELMNSVVELLVSSSSL